MSEENVGSMDIEPRMDGLNGGICVQDNALIRSAYTMSLTEKRLLMLAISKVDACTRPQKGQPIKVEVTATEWAKVFREKDPWSDLSRAADRLMGRVVIMHPKGMRRRKLNWTDSCDYYSGKVVIKFGYSISLELAGMVDELTQTNILEIAKLDSFYSVRFYELLTQFSSTGLLLITIDELRTVMNVGEKYPNFAQLNQRVIKPAVSDIQQKMPELKVSIEYVKKNNSKVISSLKFRFKKSEQRDLFSPTAKDISGKKSISRSLLDVTDLDW